MADPFKFTGPTPLEGAVEPPFTVGTPQIRAGTAAIEVTVTNHLAEQVPAAQAQVVLFVASSGRLLSFGTNVFFEPTATGSTAAIAPGATKSFLVYVDIPPGTDLADLRFDTTAWLDGPT